MRSRVKQLGTVSGGGRDGGRALGCAVEGRQGGAGV